ncbi:hypothetical protein ACE1TI_16425 [Alteribacillus sp. JSM 102045]|uniref:hypothetical protein n=1 Tax=Alteribacillus sp. JSM 102045 TaxID=1562101 RepID=UPI0035C1B03E
MLRKDEEFAFVLENEKKFSITMLTNYIFASRSGYYKWKNEHEYRLKHLQDEELYDLISKVFEQSKGTYGKWRIKAALYREAFQVRTAIFRFSSNL